MTSFPPLILFNLQNSVEIILISSVLTVRLREVGNFARVTQLESGKAKVSTQL